MRFVLGWLAMIGIGIGVHAQPAAKPPAQTAGSPVVIDGCAMTTNVINDFTVHRGGPWWYSILGLGIAFHNTASEPVTDVRFRVDYRGDVQTIDDHGSFAPGTEIRHEFKRFTDEQYDGSTPDSCRVVSVTFANGTAWPATTSSATAPAPPATR